MSLLLAVMMQAVSASPPERVDLTISQPCQPTKSADGEVVVCANRNGDSPYRLRDAPPAQQQALPDGQVQIADGLTGSAETENVDVGGFPSERLMLRLKVKF